MEIVFAQIKHIDVIIAFIEQARETATLVSLTPQRVAEMILEEKIVIALEDGVVVGTAAITASYSGQWYEFGSWAVKPDAQKSGIGMKLFWFLMDKRPKGKYFAVCNDNSLPIFKKMGGEVLPQNTLPREVFDFCKQCNCDKEKLQRKLSCVDTFMDLGPVLSSKNA